MNILKWLFGGFSADIQKGTRKKRYDQDLESWNNTPTNAVFYTSDLGSASNSEESNVVNVDTSVNSFGGFDGGEFGGGGSDGSWDDSSSSDSGGDSGGGGDSSD